VFLASIFAVWLGWLPAPSPMSTGGNWSLAAQLVMPVLVIALYDVGYLIAMIRVSMIAVMRQPFIPHRGAEGHEAARRDPEARAA